MPKNYVFVLIHCIDFIIQLDLSLSFFYFVGFYVFVVVFSLFCAQCFVCISLCMMVYGILCVYVSTRQASYGDVANASVWSQPEFFSHLYDNVLNEIAGRKKKNKNEVKAFQIEGRNQDSYFKGINFWSPLLPIQCIYQKTGLFIKSKDMCACAKCL